MVALLVVSVPNLDITLEPGVFELKHLFEGWDRSRYIPHLEANLRHTAQVVEVLLVFDAANAALRELRHILTKEVLGEVDEDFILLDVCETDIQEGGCRLYVIRNLLSLLLGRIHARGGRIGSQHFDVCGGQLA